MIYNAFGVSSMLCQVKKNNKKTTISNYKEKENGNKLRMASKSMLHFMYINCINFTSHHLGNQKESLEELQAFLDANYSQQEEKKRRTVPKVQIIEFERGCS